MKKFIVSCLAAIAALITTPAEIVSACTNILVSRLASKDGSVYTTYSADAPFMPRLIRVQGGTHKPGTWVDVRGWEDNEIRGKVRQVARTYSVVGLMNEHQVSIAETTTGGREELVDPKGILDYDGLMLLALQRSRTARQAIKVIDGLVQEYGYGSEGESFSIADKNEVWLMEIIAKGPDEKGAVWVAARVPDGYVTAHANISRITTFPLDDANNWLFSKDVVDFALKRGFYDPKNGKPFSWRDAYHPNLSEIAKRACAGRVWSVYRRVAPSRNFSPDYFRAVPGAEDYPLFIRPDKKLSTKDVMQLMRDHFEGTEFDMSTGLCAGPFQSPYRFRNLRWELDGKKYIWERCISTQQAGFVMVAQSRNWLPDEVGGVYWFTPDDCYTSCFTPLYCGTQKLPESYAKGDHNAFSWDSAWWVFNLVSNLTYDRYSRILPDVQAVQIEREAAYLAMQPSIDEAAESLAGTDPKMMREFLTNYTTSTAEALFKRWQQLAKDILTKHNDGYVNERNGKEPHGINYPTPWLKRVVKDRGKWYLLTEKNASGH